MLHRDEPAGRGMDVPDDELPAAIRNAALDLLTRREHSYRELNLKLLRRYPGAGLVIDAELHKLVQSELQSDSRFCETFVRSRIRQGHGPHRIGQDLRQRGVSNALVDEFLWQAEVDWHAQLVELYSRRYRDTEPADARDRARRMRFLQSRGFGYDLIRDVMA